MQFLLEIVSLADQTLYNSTGYLFVVLGILVSIRFLGYPDLTVDGSFTFGAALYAMGIHKGLVIPVALIVAVSGGVMAGLLTALINRYLGIGKIICSVIVMLTLITLSPYVTGGGTVGLLNEANIFSKIQQIDLTIAQYLAPTGYLSLHLLFNLISLVLWLVLVGCAWFFFSTKLGVQMRYLGSARQPGLLSKVAQDLLLLAGLAIGNGLVALGGAIEAERKGGFSLNMGLGVILVGLACLVLGESIVKARVKRDELYLVEYCGAALLGVLVYSFVLQLLLRIGVTFYDVRFTTVFFLLVLLAIAARKHPNTGRLF